METPLRVLGLAVAEGGREADWETLDRSGGRLAFLLRLNPIMIEGKILVIIPILSRA